MLVTDGAIFDVGGFEILMTKLQFSWKIDNLSIFDTFGTIKLLRICQNRMFEKKTGKYESSENVNINAK